jgi:hypothetical protein
MPCKSPVAQNSIRSSGCNVPSLLHGAPDSGTGPDDVGVGPGGADPDGP